MKRIFISIAVLIAPLLLIYGMYAGIYKTFPYSQVMYLKNMAESQQVEWDLTSEVKVSERFNVVNTSSFSDENDTLAALQNNKKAPLIVSLHTWSGNYLQPDPIANDILRKGWNYIRPDFQGTNDKTGACLSEKVIKDIDSAISWALDNGSVDKDSIIVIGASGGGYTALGYQSKSKHSIRHTFSWVPITDLHDWYWQSLNRGNKYAADILGCVGGKFDEKSLRERSPIFMAPNRASEISIYAGIDDGYRGSVPISHSILYFNKFAKSEDAIPKREIVDLITKTKIKTKDNLGDRSVYIDEHSLNLRLVVFDGAHEMLEKAAINEIEMVLE